MPYKDREKQRAYQAEWMHERREAWLVKKGPCVDCGGRDRLEFDHLNSEEKTSHRIWSWSDARIEAELQKCVVRCQKCHQQKTELALDGGYKFTRELCEEIRQAHENGEGSVRQLAKRFGVSKSQVHRVIRFEQRDAPIV